MSKLLEIDGAFGEGGGQLLRTAVALSAVTRVPLRIVNVRANRSKPGLAAQHLAAVKAVAALCHARTSGLELGSSVVEMHPGRCRGGDFRFDVGTAGSITLVLQALLPVMLVAGQDVRVTVVGGTDVRAAPPLDYFRFVLLPCLQRIGVRAELHVIRRGYYPRGGGEVSLWVRPSLLHPLAGLPAGSLRSLGGLAHVSRLPAHIAQRMAQAASRVLAAVPIPLRIETQALNGIAAAGPGGAVVVWGETAGGFLGAGRVAERGVPAEQLGEEAARELMADLQSGSTADVHLADQLLIYMALGGEGSGFAVRELSLHARTAMAVIERFLPVRFRCREADGLVFVETELRKT